MELLNEISPYSQDASAELSAAFGNPGRPKLNCCEQANVIGGDGSTPGSGIGIEKRTSRQRCVERGATLDPERIADGKPVSEDWCRLA